MPTDDLQIALVIALQQWWARGSPAAGRRALPACARAVQIRLQSGASLFYTTRVFPTVDAGTDAGWRYRYPVHEARF